MTVPEMTSGESFAPLVRSVEVAADRATAFALFTDRIAEWWPVDGHSVFGAGASVGFEDDALVERHGDRATTWGEVLEWDPPRTFTMTWHPGHDTAESTEVTVSFHEERPGRTRVQLVHTGWERRTPDVRSSYAQGWTRVLGRYADVAGVSPGS